MKDNRTNRKRRKMAWRKKWGKDPIKISVHYPPNVRIFSLPTMKPPHSRKIKPISIPYNQKMDLRRIVIESIIESAINEIK